jgi:hypothetical protein
VSDGEEKASIGAREGEASWLASARDLRLTVTKPGEIWLNGLNGGVTGAVCAQLSERDC